MMKICALQGADAWLAQLTSRTHALVVPADVPALSRGSEAGTEGTAEAGVGVLLHQANDTDDPRGSARVSWWRRVFGG